MTSLTSTVLTIAPELSRWLCSNDADTTLTEAVKAATGTIDPDAAAVALQSPIVATQLRLSLGRLAAEWDQSQKAANFAQLSALVQPPSSGSSVTATPSAALAWAAPGISAAVLVVFTLMMSFIMLHGLPAGAETAVNLLLGTLAAMATSVVSYWVGSSAGSARKDDRLAQTGK